MKTALPLRTDLKQSAVERVFDALGEAVLMFDTRGTVLYANPTARQLLGVEPGLSAPQLGPSVGAAAVEWLHRALRGGPVGAATPAPAVRLDDGRRAHLSLVPMDAQRFVLHVLPLAEPTVPAADSGPIPLDESSSELLRMFWNSPFPATLQDLDFRLVSVNRAYLDFTGFPETMLVGLDPLSLQPEEDRAVNLVFRKQLRLDLEAGRPPPLIERRILDAAGRERWFRAMRRPVRDPKGRMLLLSVLQDATDEHASRALAERSLHELEQWLDLSPLGMVLIDAGGLLVRSNAAFEALVGTAPVSLPEAEPALRELFGWRAKGPAAELQPGAQPLVHESLLPLPHAGPGAFRKLRATARCVEGSPGQRRYLAVVEDRSVEEERDLARLQLAALVDTAGVGVATFHESLGWLHDSASAADGGAAGAAPALGALSVNKALVEPGSLPDFERLQQALRDGERAEVRYAVRHPDLGHRWLLTRVEPGALALGQRTTSVVTLDVTEQQLARVRNEQLLRELATILDGTSAGIAYLRGDRLMRCNQRFWRMLALESEPAAGAPLASLTNANPRARDVIEASVRALEDAPLFETEFEIGETASSRRWYSLSVRRNEPQHGGTIEATAVLTDITRLKSQQSELAMLARDHELMFGLSQIATGYLRAGKVERANAALARLTGHSPEALAGMEHAALFEDRAEYLRIAAQQRVALQQQGHWSGERRLKRADGVLIWVQVGKRLVRPGDIGGGAVATYVPVDDRRRAEESLLVQAERTRAILDSVLVGVVTVGEHGIEWMNRSARRMFGGELSDFTGEPMSVVATEEPDHPFRRGSFASELEEGASHTFECRVRAKDERVFWVAGNVVLTARDAGGPQLTYALLDIDRRRQAEAMSAQTQASLRRIIEMAPLAITLRDAASLRVLQINAIAAQSIGRAAPHELVGRTPEQSYSAESAAVLRADMVAALQAGDGVTRREYKLPGAPGEPPRVWDARYLPLATRDGEPPDQLLVVAADVTEQRAAEAARLEAAIAQRELLVREVHHRIKNNLQGVAGLLTQIAQRRPEVAPVIHEAIGQVQAIAQVYGLQVGAAGPLRVRSVIDAIVGSVTRLHGRPIALSVEGAAAERWALPEAESIPIALAVNELLVNAVRHAQQGEIGCTLDFGDAEVRIGIANPGELPEGFDLSRIRGGVSGLGLVRALLPRRGASLSIANRDGHVLALVVLAPPAVAALEPPSAARS